MIGDFEGADEIEMHGFDEIDMKVLHDEVFK